MRTYCLEDKRQEVYGIMTNFKEWIFTKYSLNKEVSDIHRGAKNINPFEIS